MAAAAISAVVACGDSGPAEAAGGGDPVSGEHASFLARHWERPVPPQGDPPAGWPDAVVDLSPAACGACHPAQYADWSTSLHARAYSPGLAGQLEAWRESDPATVESCMACHGPLSEQLREVGGPRVENPDHDPALERAGVVCAACHVRGWRRWGPPRRDGSVAPAAAGTPHEGAIRAPAFESSEFCAPCHQFEEPAPAGKPLENTLREWEATEFAARGVTCQACHMPDRRHRWRGIHDPETTRSGITPGWRVRGDPGTEGFSVRLALSNTGTGHHFPTYVTPAVDLEIAFVDAAGDTLAVRRRTLQRVVEFDDSAWSEVRDDRIPHGETRALEWRGPAPAAAARVVGRVVVRPDAFYAGFFADLLADSPDHPGRALLEEARARARASPYELLRRESPLR